MLLTLSGIFAHRHTFSDTFWHFRKRSGTFGHFGRSPEVLETLDSYRACTKADRALSGGSDNAR
eukprot:14418869-Alexandrium_andersonii.AAC.1